jgi:hypothetical protein
MGPVSGPARVSHQGVQGLGSLSGVVGLWLKILLLRAHRDSFSEADNAAFYIGLLIA